MAKQKKVKAYVKLAIQAGKANPAPPIGPALGQHGVPIMDFCKEFNAKTQSMGDFIIPVVLTVYEDRSFTFITKTPVTSDLIKKAIKVQKGSGTPNKDKVGKITKAQIEEIAKTKMPDLNTKTLDQAIKIIEGTARSMGVEVEKQ
ncbi:50S ribosomal protein L11 [candidate division WWE3 bacterium RBG_13_37_7]|uniref:Large ribosomal subunit protein uL11 n=1 Tax=candidate division WWE3 bacterium RBG_13_37_7 TaxID=1802609 RepID=A0A1F4U090_UNCKA|nr:MAG: 50S ribosomal protein L11 [candidate division WWE3 bacterium RBG_13_37_7]